jgi:putative peptide zinc metalloprotease protein
MNLSEAFDAALPEMPKARYLSSRPPMLDPDLVIREDVVGGELIIGVLQRGSANFFRFPPEHWELALLFDGIRSYEEIAAAYAEKTGVPIETGDVRQFAENMDEQNFWYKSAQEKNLALSEKLLAQRSRRANRKSKIDLSHISFSAWDPDRYLTWLDSRIGRFIFSPWFAFAVLLLLLFETMIYLSRWSVLGPDIALYFNFTRKSALDLAQFWILFLILGFFHETAHGLSCKHYGGQVHSMGLMFLYLAPAFYVDVTETWISANKIQRLTTIVAGVGVELIICGFAMMIWINTLAGEWLHDFSYQIILLTGIAVVVINFNPLIKLDGYYFFTELIGIPDLKERSTQFLSGWFQKHVLRLPVEVPVVARKRAPLYALYAFLSGFYSYMLLFFVVRFTYNVASKWLAEFALIPAGLLAFAVFRSRLRSLREVIGRLWARATGSGLGWLPLVSAAAALAILFAPIWRDRVDAMYVIEPRQSATLHAAVAGRVQEVLVNEGQHVRAGQPLLRMTSVDASALRSTADAQTTSTRYETYEAELRGQSIGTAAADQQGALRATALAHDAGLSLAVRAPIDGTVLNSDPGALLNQSVASGEALLSLADSGARMARVFVPVSALDRISSGAEVAIIPPGRFTVMRLKLSGLDGAAVSLPPGLVAKQDYKGIVLPTYYSSRVPLPSSAHNLALGMGGKARIFGARRSLAGRAARTCANLLRAHVW